MYGFKSIPYLAKASSHAILAGVEGTQFSGVDPSVRSERCLARLSSRVFLPRIAWLRTNLRALSSGLPTALLTTAVDVEFLSMTKSVRRIGTVEGGKLTGRPNKHLASG
jgi:hypothetical protein